MTSVPTSDLLQRLGALTGTELTLSREPATSEGPSTANQQTLCENLPNGSVITASRPRETDPYPSLAGVLEFAKGLASVIHDSELESAALSDELLERYEEITLLHSVAAQLVAVFDEAEACAKVLEATLQAVPAARAAVLLVQDNGVLHAAASVGGAPTTPCDGLIPALASSLVTRQSPLLLDRGQDFQNEVLAEPVLGVPLRASAPAGANGEFLGAIVLTGRPEGRFSAGEASLAATVGRHLATAVENDRLVAALRERERLERELELAADIQRRLLPHRPPHLPGLELSARCLPAESIGGDYYDFVVTEGSVTVLVADVSGHGVGPGLMMAMTRTVLRRELSEGASISEALTATNRLMWDDLVATGLFITLFCLRYEPASGVITYVSGGHHPALLRRADSSVEALDSPGFPLGFLEDAPFPEECGMLGPGDGVVLFTDGIVEELSVGGQMFGKQRLVDLVSQEPVNLADSVITALQSWRGAAPQQDDITLVHMRRQGEI